MEFSHTNSLHSLTKKELEILQYVHNHSQEVSQMSIQAFAKEIHYSTSTVLRFCRKLGFSGFPEFKYSLKTNKNIENTTTSNIQSFSKIKSSIFMDLDGTTGLLNTDNILQIANILSDNPPIYLHKPGGLTDVPVNYLESMLFLSGCRYVQKSSSKKLTQHLIHTAESNSVFIFISNSGAYSSTVDVAKEAKLHGMIVISISSIENNDLAEVSDYNLRLFSRQRENVGADAASRLSTFFVLSSLIEFFALYKKGVENDENLSK